MRLTTLHYSKNIKRKQCTYKIIAVRHYYNIQRIKKTINPTSYTTLNTSTIEKDNNILIPHTGLVPITNQNPNNLRRHYINRSSIVIYQNNSINSNSSYTLSNVSNNIDPEWKESDTSSKNSYESTRKNNN